MLRRLSPRSLARPIRLTLLALTLLAAAPAPASAQAPAPRPAAEPPPHPLAPLLELVAELERSGALEARPDAPDQLGAWRAVAIEGATCGRGAPFRFYFSESDAPDAGILILLNGGGACMKEGPPPEGATGIARQLHCMAFENFEDGFMTDATFTGLGSVVIPQVLPLFRREAANPFADYHFVAVPYCTGDVFAGNVSEAYDYDPGPGVFEVVHRGHLNVLGVLGWLYRTYPEDRHVVLTGISAGGFGAIYNFPDAIERWPRTTLVPDSGIAPPISDALLAREAERVAARWDAGALIPYYCPDADCLSSSYRLLAAHAAQHDGQPAGWRPFGYIQSQQDAVLVEYLETRACRYQLGLRRGRVEARPPNLRAYVPATDKHVFHAVNPLQGEGLYVSQAGVNVLDWFRQAAAATSPAEQPAEVIDPWLPCNQLHLPFGLLGLER